MERYKLTLVRSDDGDWEGIYVNGVLHIEGHSLISRDWVDLLSECKNISEVDYFVIEGKCLEEIGASLPHYLSDIPRGYLL